MKTLKPLNFSAILFVVGLLILVTFSSAGASDFRSGEQIVIAEGEVVEDDLVVMANTIEVYGTIKGDLIAFASNTTLGVNGIIEGDLIVAGQSVVVNGTVQDDVRIAGAVLQLGETASVGDDLMAAGYSLETKTGSQVGGAVVFGGYQALLAGAIEEDLNAGAQGISLQGTIGGDVEVEVGSPTEGGMPFNPFAFMPGIPSMPDVPVGLTIGESAEIGGTLTYQSSQAIEIPPQTVQGEVVQQEPEAAVETGDEPVKAPPSPGAAWARGLFSTFLSLLIVGLLLAWLFPVVLGQGTAVLREKPWRSLGTGVLALIGFFLAFLIVPVLLIVLVVVLSFLSLGGLTGLGVLLTLAGIALLALVYILSVSFVAKLIACQLVGRLIFKAFKSSAAENRFWPLIVGVLIFALLQSIPYIGWIFTLAAILFGLGALTLWVIKRLQKPKPAVEPVMAE